MYFLILFCTLGLGRLLQLDSYDTTNSSDAHFQSQTIFSPSPAAAAKGKVARCYAGPLSSRTVTSMMKCDSHGPLVIHVAKLYAESDGQSFAAFGRIYSGTVKPGEQQK